MRGGGRGGAAIVVIPCMPGRMGGSGRIKAEKNVRDLKQEAALRTDIKSGWEEIQEPQNHKAGRVTKETVDLHIRYAQKC